MKLDFWGHATILFQGADCSLLCDPLLSGVHHEGLYDVYPQRSLDLERLPPIDALLVTHRHLDHFDLPSLAAVPRRLPVFAPADPLIIGCLQGLGFTSIYELENFSTIKAASLEITPTPGAPGAVEHGFVLRDGDLTVWNLVDTFPSPDAIAEVKRRYRDIDLAIVPWQPLQDGEISGGGARAFPYDAYAALIANVLQIGARTVVPGACGFRAIGPNAWMNHVMFPVTRARFVEDIVLAAPRWRSHVFEMDPGDQLEITRELVSPRRRQLGYCTAEPYDWEPLAHRPHDAVNPVTEQRGELFTVAACLRAVEAFLEGSLPGLIARERAAFEWHFRFRVQHAIEVAFADDRRSWIIDFSGDEAKIRLGRSPMADASSILTASLLTGLIAGSVSWEYAALSAEYRHYNHAYTMGPTGLTAPRQGRVRDPLRQCFGDSRAIERCLTAELTRLVPSASPEGAPQGQQS